MVRIEVKRCCMVVVTFYPRLGGLRGTGRLLSFSSLVTHLVGSAIGMAHESYQPPHSQEGGAGTAPRKPHANATITREHLRSA